MFYHREVILIAPQGDYMLDLHEGIFATPRGDYMLDFHEGVIAA